MIQILIKIREVNIILILTDRFVIGINHGFMKIGLTGTPIFYQHIEFFEINWIDNFCQNLGTLSKIIKIL